MRVVRTAVGIGAVILLGSCAEPADTPTAPEDLKPAFAITLPTGAPITLTNGLPEADPNHFRVEIARGGRSSLMVQNGTDVLFAFLGILDLGVHGVHPFDASDPQGPVLVAPNAVQTAANILTGAGEVTVLMTSVVLPGAEFLATTYQVESDFDLGGSRLFEYVDFDILGAGSDAVSVSGSVAGGDLVLRQEDGGIVVDRVAGDGLTGFASNFFPTLRGNILGGGFDPPPGGNLAAVFGDMTTAFEFELAGASASVATAMGSTPNTVTVQTVDIDVRSVVNVSSHGVIPVVLLASDDFDPMIVDPTTLTFGPGLAAPAHDVNQQGNLHRRDVDGDGDDDRILHFRTQETGLTADDDQACLTAIAGDALYTACDDIEVREARRGPEGVTGRLTGITFFVNNAVCTAGPSLEFFLNGVSLGTADPASPCACNADELTVSFNDRNALRNWRPGGDNTVTVTIDDTPAFAVALGYIRAAFDATGQSAVFPVFDATGGDASTRNICDGLIWNSDQSSFTVQVP